MTTDGATVERRSPEAAFGLLSSERRVAILRALGEADGPLSFSALRAAVGDPDSGQFNYHLGKLVGSFVVHDEDGYALSLAGGSVYGAILSGAYTADAVLEPFAFDGPCPSCGNAELTASYADELAAVSCPACDEWRNEFSFPPATLDQFDRDELPFAFDRWMRGTVGKVLQGFCSNCGGRVAGELARADGATPVRTVYGCGRCGDELSSSPTLPVLFDPTSVAFFAEHGVDVFEDPSWRYVDAAEELKVVVASEDPLTATIRVVVDGDELVATVDAAATVVEVESE
jgi:hypothetical protein